jgi:hypothetical protein
MMHWHLEMKLSTLRQASMVYVINSVSSSICFRPDSESQQVCCLQDQVNNHDVLFQVADFFRLHVPTVSAGPLPTAFSWTKRWMQQSESSSHCQCQKNITMIHVGASAFRLFCSP